MSRHLLDFDIPWDGIDGNYGGLMLEVLLVGWCFIGLMVVCDEYLVPALETLCRRWSIPEDVAGATFMALGSAAPELIISTVSVVQSSMNDNGTLSFGVSTVLGSGMMAFSAIPAMCCYATSGEVVLKRRPLLRDVFFYFICVLVLLSVIWDGVVTLSKSILLLAIYVIYLLTVILGKPIRKGCQKCTSGQERTTAGGMSLEEGLIDQDKNRETSILTEPSAPAGSLVSDEPVNLRLTKSGHYEHGVGGVGSLARAYQQTTATPERVPLYTPPKSAKSLHSDSESEGPTTVVGYMWHIFSWPVHIILKITCPDAGEDAPWENFYIPAVLITFSWVSVFSFVISSIIERWVELSGVNRAIFGLLLVSTAAQVPDAVESYAVTKNGYGSMALANALGSQVINIAVGLGLPWSIQCTHSEMKLQKDLDIACYTMLVVTVATGVIFYFNGCCTGAPWKASLNRRKSLWFLLTYVAAIVGWLGIMAALGKLGDTHEESEP